MEGLRILLLGGFTVQLGDEPLPPIPSRVGRSLFAYLVVNRARAHPREEIVGIFWPELSESRGRRRLSHTLWQIQDALGELPGGEPHLDITTDRLRFNTETSYWLDVEEFERYVDAFDGERSTVTRTASLRHAVDLYRGDLLSGFYDDWVLVEQERLNQRYLHALGRLVELAKSRGDYEEALVYARRLTNQDPLREDAHREVMRLSMLLGRTSEALRQFERCRSVLFEELGTDPAAATVDLYERITHHRRVGPEPVPGVPVPRGAIDPDIPLVGRARERRVLVDLLEEVLAGRGHAVLVEGEPGVGKTRLLMEVAEDAHWRGLTVLWGAGRDGAGARPYGPVVEALEDELTTLRVEQLAHRVAGVWLREAARILPPLRRAASAAPQDGLTGVDASRRVRESLVRILIELGHITPTVLVLEDLHWADRETLDLVHALAGRLDTTRLVLVLTYRDQDVRDRSEAWATIRAVDRDARPSRVLLEPLTAFETAELVRGSLRAGGVAPAVANRLHRDTGGNPLFLLETLRSLRELGWDVADGEASGGSVPGSVREVIAGRLAHLDADLLELLATAAVIGPEVDLETLASAAAVERVEVVDALDGLLARGLLRADGPGYAFQHDLTRRVVMDVLDPVEARDLHRRVGRALEATHPDRYEALAHHFEQAGIRQAALRYHQLAGERALELHAYSTAAQHLRRAIALMQNVPVDAEQRYDVLVTFEEVASVLALRDEQAEVLDRLAAMTGGDSEREVDVLRRRAWLAAHTDRFPAALEATDEALSAAAGDEEARTAALTARGTILLWAGRVADAVAPLEEAVALSDGRGDRPEGDARRALGDVLRNLQRYADAGEQLERALEVYREHDDLRGQAEVAAVLGAVRMETGAIDAAERSYREAIERSRELGHRYVEGVALVNLANLLRVQGRVSEALAGYERTIAIFRELGNRRGVATVQLNLASLRHAVLGQDDRARDEAQQARSFFEGTDEARLLGMAIDTTASIARREGDFDEARTLLDRGFDAIDPDDAWTDVQLSRTLAEIELDAGDPRAALAVLDRAAVLCERSDLGDDQAAGVRGLRAMALARLQRTDEAIESIEEVVASMTPGVDRAYLIHLWHHRILVEAGRQPDAAAAIQRAHEHLVAILAGLSDEERERALRDVPEHAEIVSTWEHERPETATVRLAASDAPTGRPLREDELVEVVVVVDAPEDGAMEDAIERRRTRLLRILAQATGQGAAPTVMDLASLLEVSSATVRRDLAELRDRGRRVETRGSRAG